ncbi:MAG: hypothetical protein J6Z50_06930 [Fibrobacterales bacterium]|nr:hypothetical protein [Fibrobacterales bacterium]MBP5350846.1 hypothetical protein [Fibrobacterales bacterium]
MESRDHEFLETVLWTVRAVARHLRMCCLVVGISTLAAVVVTQFVDKEYDAKAVVLPPTSSDPVAQLAGSLGSLSKIVGASPELHREANVLEQFLSSRELHKAIIDSFGFVHLYKMDKNPKKPPKEADVLKKFRKNFWVETNDLDLFEISFRDKDPARAKAVVDFALARLDSIYSALKTNVADEDVGHYRRRIAQVEVSVDSVREEMKRFQAKHGVVDPEVQYEETVKLIASAMAEEEQAKLEMEVEREQHGDKSLRYSELKSRHDAAKKSVESLKKRKDSVLMPVEGASSVMVAFAQLKADLEVQLELLAGLKLQLESAEIQARKGAPKFTVIERPWVNDKKVSPPRAAITALTFVLSGVLATFVSVLIEFCADQRKSDGRLYRLLRSIGEALRPRK